MCSSRQFRGQGESVGCAGAPCAAVEKVLNHCCPGGTRQQRCGSAPALPYPCLSGVVVPDSDGLGHGWSGLHSVPGNPMTVNCWRLCLVPWKDQFVDGRRRPGHVGNAGWLEESSQGRTVKRTRNRGVGVLRGQGWAVWRRAGRQLLHARGVGPGVHLAACVRAHRTIRGGVRAMDVVAQEQASGWGFGRSLRANPHSAT